MKSLKETEGESGEEKSSGKWFWTQRLTVRFGADSIENECADREIDQYYRRLLINAEIGQCGTASTSGEDRDIVISNSVSGAGHSCADVVGSKKTAFGAM